MKIEIGMFLEQHNAEEDTLGVRSPETLFNLSDSIPHANVSADLLEILSQAT